MERLNELGFYGLAGHSNAPADLLTEVREAEDLGLGSVFLSERFNLKDACTLSGAAGAVSTELGIATAATNHTTRHLMVTATFATTMHRLTGGRFSLGLGRGIDMLFSLYGLAPITGAQMEDACGVLRRLWHGEMVAGHDGPAGRYPLLVQDTTFDEHIPITFTAMGDRTLELAGRVADAVVLHTYFTDETLSRCVGLIRRGAERAGRDPASVRVWSVLGTVGDHLEEDLRLRKTVGRLATYLQGYGDLLVRVNGWNPDDLQAIRRSEVFSNPPGAFDAVGTRDQYEALAEVIPDEWLAAAATGAPERCAQRVLDQFTAGADSVILHGATPTELAPVLAAYRDLRPESAAPTTLPPNPGWSSSSDVPAPTGR